MSYRANSDDMLHPFAIEPAEIDYLKQTFFAYLTGTDPLVR